MALIREKIVGQDFDLGYGTTTVTADSGGSLTGSKVGIHTFLGPYSVVATDFSGADIGAQINAAYAALPTTGGAIHVPVTASCYDFTTPIVFNTIGKAVTLKGLSAGGHANTSAQARHCAHQ